MTERLVVKRDQAYVLEFNFVAFSPDSKSFVSSRRNQVTLWEVSGGKELASIPLNNPVALAFSPDGKRIAVSDNNAKIFLFDGALKNNEMTINQDSSSAYSLAFTPDGTKLVSGHSSETVWDQTIPGALHFWKMK